MAVLRELYRHTRFPAMALAYALTRDKDKAFELSRKAHVKEGGLPSDKISRVSLLRRVVKYARAEKVVSGEAVPDLLTKFSSMDKTSISLWVLTTICGYSSIDASQIIGLKAESLEEQIHIIQGRLTTQDARQLTSITESLLNKKELWSEVVFTIEQHRSTGKLVFRSFMAVLAATLLFFISREAMMLISILGHKPSQPTNISTDRYDNPLFFRHFHDAPSPGQPQINQALHDSLRFLENDQLMRVSFRFYDREIMRDTRTDGKNLEDLYTEIYNSSYGRGRVNTLAANAITRYYADYERPFQTKQRTRDFSSSYSSIYNAVIHLAQNSGFAQTVEAYPEIFADKDSFEKYLLSDAFLTEAPYLSELLKAEFEVNASKVETPMLRQQYEDAIFTFTNPAGHDGKVTVAGFSFHYDELQTFFELRERLGKALYQNSVKRCIQLLPPEAQVSSDILEGNDSSLLSANLTKEQILRIAKVDDRFFFLGLAPWQESQPHKRIEAELALRSHEDLLRRHDVYMIDDHYLLYSINYAAPLRLPAGFIDDIRKKLECENTLFEKELQYYYQMRYAHPQTRTGYSILRALEIREDISFTTPLFKYFSKMAAY